MVTFIFAEDIIDLALSGKTELKVPETARISLEAWEVIRDRGIRVVFTAAAADVPEARKTVSPPAGEKSDSAASPPDGEPGYTEEDIERIVDRVVRKFRQLKNGKDTAPQPAGYEPEEDDDLVICRCEEITRGEIKEAIRNGMLTLNGIKRVTRAGMGLCQGLTCQRLVSQILAAELGLNPADVEPATARAPVRTIRLSAFASG